MSADAFDPTLPIPGRRPFMQFYTQDYECDARVKSCSPLAELLLLRTIFLMHRCTPYGHLAIDGIAMSARQMAHELRMTPYRLRKLFDELLSKQVLHRADDGVIYCKRMVRDEYRRQVQAVAGKEGAEHGHLGAAYGVLGGRPTKAQVLARKMAPTGLKELEGSYPKPPPSNALAVSDFSSSLEAPAARDEKEIQKAQIQAEQASIQERANAVCHLLRTEFSDVVLKVKPHSRELHELLRQGLQLSEIAPVGLYLREQVRFGGRPKPAAYVYAVAKGWREDDAGYEQAQADLARQSEEFEARGGVIEGGLSEGAVAAPVDPAGPAPVRARRRARGPAKTAPTATVPSTMKGTTTFCDPSTPAPVPAAVKALKARLKRPVKSPVAVEKAEATADA